MYLSRPVTLVFTAVTPKKKKKKKKKNDVTLCKLDVDVKNRKRSLVASTSLKWSRNSLKEKCYFIASSTLKIKCCKSKGLQEKVYIMDIWCGCRSVTLVTDFPIHTIYQRKILIFLPMRQSLFSFNRCWKILSSLWAETAHTRREK